MRTSSSWKSVASHGDVNGATGVIIAQVLTHRIVHMLGRLLRQLDLAPCGRWVSVQAPVSGLLGDSRAPIGAVCRESLTAIILDFTSFKGNLQSVIESLDRAAWVSFVICQRRIYSLAIACRPSGSCAQPISVDPSLLLRQCQRQIHISGGRTSGLRALSYTYLGWDNSRS